MARPKSRRAHDQALDAAIELFATHGVDGTSMDAIAETSGVSKATIYKHWADKDTLCLEVMVRAHGLDQPRPKFDSGDLRSDMVALLTYRPPEHRSGLRERLMPHLIAYAARNQKFGTAWRSRVMEPQRVQVVELLERGIGQGRFPPDLDIGLGLALLLGPMMYFHIFGANAFLPENLAEHVVDAFWRAFACSGRVLAPNRSRTGRNAPRGRR